MPEAPETPVAEPGPATESKKVQVSCSPGFLEWLAEEGIGVAFTTYQTNRLFLVGRDGEGRLAAFERLLDRPMGLAVTPERLWVATSFQLWRFDQVLAAGDRYRGHDRLFVPRVGHVTGELDVHDVHPAAGDGGGQGGDDVLFVNTLYSCLARPSDRHSFEPVWRPPFVSKLVPEDRCHLNGLAVEGGRPRFVTAVARSDERQGWRAHRADGGVVLDVDSGEVVASGLSMPHSPRLHRGELYVLDSGHGDFGRVDLGSGRFEPMAFCPGYLRGLAFRGDAALVGLSKPRDRTFQGLPLDRRLADEDAEPSCGLRVIDLASGETRHWLEVHGVVLEL
ncbi:MAG TPA: TIGR03032 family protein, partial [Thermoanaerobaculia bacterium]|nr:TIGR03032 family protein [Thermoanaerobaculia bacterium]